MKSILYFTTMFCCTILFFSTLIVSGIHIFLYLLPNFILWINFFIYLKVKILEGNDTIQIALLIELARSGKNFQTYNKNMVLPFISLLLLQALHWPLRIYLNVIITFYIFSERLIYANILEHFNLMLDQFQWASTFDLVWYSIFWCKWGISWYLLVLFTIFIIAVK